MKQIRWNALKSERLKKTRGVSFEEILDAKLLDILKHPNRVNQSILIYEFKGYVWVVPCVMEGEDMFLKTLYPSRKYTDQYKRRSREKNKTD